MSEYHALYHYFMSLFYYEIYYFMISDQNSTHWGQSHKGTVPIFEVSAITIHPGNHAGPVLHVLCKYQQNGYLQ